MVFNRGSGSLELWTWIDSTCLEQFLSLCLEQIFVPKNRQSKSLKAGRIFTYCGTIN